MSNVNNWEFAKYLDQFKTKVLDNQVKKVDEAFKIMSDPNYQWKDEDQKKVGQAKLDVLKAWLKFYQDFYAEGMKLVTQHEGIVNQMSKWYSKWREDISNDGRQEAEMMSMQADMLNEIFSEMYKELQPLNLDIKEPKALNLK